MLALKKSTYSNYRNIVANFRLFHSKIFTSIQNPTFIAIPDVPNVENGPHTLQDYKRFPDISALPPDTIFASMSKAFQLYETQVTKFCDDTDRRVDLSAIKELEEIIVPVEAAFQTANVISKVNYSINSHIIMNSLAAKFNTSKRDRWTSEALYKLCNDIKKKLSVKNMPQENALLSLYLHHFNANGMKLDPAKRDHLHNIANQLHEKQTSLIRRLIISGSFIKQPIHVDDLVPNTPAWFKNKVHLGQMKNNSATMSVDDGPMVLKYCQNRTVREKMWTQLNERDTFESNVTRNTVILSEIRRIQRNFVEMLGYESYAEFSLVGQMADNVEKIMTMVEGYKKLHSFKAKEEASALKDWAQKKFDINDSAIRGWDLEFFLNQRKEDSLSSVMYNIAPLSQVLGNILNTCEDLFGLSIELCSPNSIDGEVFLEGFSDSMLPSDSCQMYRVKDRAQPHTLLGYFVCDLYSRSNKMPAIRDVIPLRCRSSAAGTVPAVYWVDSLASLGSHSADILISLSDVSRMCYSIGRILEAVCNSSEYWALSDPHQRPSDIQGVTGSLMQMLLMSSDIFYHRITGAKYPDKNLISNPVHNIEIMNELYAAAIDLELAVSEQFWLDIQKKLSVELLPIALEKNDLGVCYNRELFAPGSQPGRRYSPLWMNMIASDMMEPFLQAGISQWKKDTPIPEKVKSVGLKYRTQFLSQLGIKHPREAFRLFRGRDHVHSPVNITRSK